MPRYRCPLSGWEFPHPFKRGAHWIELESEMTDMPEVQRFHAWEYTGDHNNGGWSRSKLSHADIELVRATDYDALAAKLAEVEASKNKQIGVISHVAGEWKARAEAAEAALVAAYRLGWVDNAKHKPERPMEDLGDDHWVDVDPETTATTPTADALMARIKEEAN